MKKHILVCCLFTLLTAFSIMAENRPSQGAASAADSTRLSSSEKLADLENRELLIHWLEQLKSACESKDIEFLNALFSNKDIDPEVRKRAEILKHMFRKDDQIKATVNSVGITPGKTASITDGNGNNTLLSYYLMAFTLVLESSRYSDTERVLTVCKFKNDQAPEVNIIKMCSPDDPEELDMSDVFFTE